MKHLEDFVKAHRDDFDLPVPEGHLHRFDRRMQQHRHNRHRSRLWQWGGSLAASVLLMLMVGPWLRLQTSPRAEALPADLEEVTSFYTQRIEHLQAQLQAVPCTDNPLLHNAIRNDLSEIDHNYRYLLGLVKQTGYSPMLVEQLVNSLRTKEALLERILQQLQRNC